MDTWPLSTAQAQLSEVLGQATIRGPQAITHNGQIAAAVLSPALWKQLSDPHESLVDFMQRSPLAQEDVLQLERDSSPGRSVVL